MGWNRDCTSYIVGNSGCCSGEGKLTIENEHRNWSVREQGLVYFSFFIPTLHPIVMT